MLLSDLEIIIKTAELGSITAAATNLDMQVARASAAIKRVEKQLGFELFVRSTRQLRLSAMGERYLPQCIQALEILNNAKQTLVSDQDEISGELHLTAPSDLGRNFIMPWLDELAGQHPQLMLKLILNDHALDFYRDGVDIALRYGSPTDSNLYGFKICDVPRLLCASPSYVSAHQLPEHPRELSVHNGLFYQLHSIVHDTWKFSRDKHLYSAKMTGNRIANDGDLVRRWCIAGKGVALKSAIDISEDLLAQRLIPLMPKYRPTPTELWLICPSKQSINPKVRLLKALITDKCRHILSELKDRGYV
ncbi:LysR family transcriptional regulator [Thalassomonas viridans]|uniref:LysR family transcriptional regulator n=1 Tax=Thalassomonas viridans TaxID=137584 RepID=A0AAF0CE39_9GAMM|nr:LysR family transcriptional regulator [Thalassomonas viridans]WDE09196.1 LysR family transcriptional regulator [Thalassomonas viridans]